MGPCFCLSHDTHPDGIPLIEELHPGLKQDLLQVPPLPPNQAALRAFVGRRFMTRKFDFSPAPNAAIKAAETDATKRALATFGNRFGLCLYDKEQRDVEDGTGNPGASEQSKSQNIFRLFSPSGTVLAGSLSAEGFCSGLRQLIEASQKPEDIDVLNSLNAAELARLRELRPDLCNRNGAHYADLLSGLLERRRRKILSVSTPVNCPALSIPPGLAEALPQESSLDRSRTFGFFTYLGPCRSYSRENGRSGPFQGRISAANQYGQAGGDTPAADTVETSPKVFPASRITDGPRVNKSTLSIATPRRMRDPEHLRSVRKLSCLICDRAPCHAHHVKFAQRPGLSMKVSDEFVVPLCSVHHDELHRSVMERSWWEGQGINPLPIAEKLWQARDERANP